MAKPKSKSKVNEAGNYTKPALRKRLFSKIKAGTKGGKAGQWSARKAQMLALQYKKAGGGYRKTLKLLRSHLRSGLKKNGELKAVSLVLKQENVISLKKQEKP